MLLNLVIAAKLIILIIITCVLSAAVLSNLYSKTPRLRTGAQLFEGRLALNAGFLFLCSKAFSGRVFSVMFRASNHQLVDKK